MTTTLSPALATLQAAFLALMPRITAHGEVYFRNVRCQATKEECLAEMIALSWRWFLRLVERGRDPTQFVSALASFAARAVKSGRRVCGQERARDVLSPLAQKRKGFTVCKLPDFGTLSGNPLTEALIDNTQTPVPDQVHFRIDFIDWLTSLGDRERRIATDMLLNERTLDLADRYKVSPARISQLRREFKDDWSRFCGDALDGKEGACQG